MLETCVIGAGGLVGRNLCKALLEKGCRTTAITRRTARPPELADVDWFCSEAMEITNLMKRMAPWDVVVDLRAFTSRDLAGLMEHCFALASHWIHVSTIYVYRRLNEVFLSDNMTAFLPIPITEDTPCRPSGEYGSGKLDCEQAWLKAHADYSAPVTIARLPFIYGPYDRSNRARFYIDRLIAGDTISLPNFGASVVDLLFAEDLAQVLIRLAECPESVGCVYNIGARQAVPLRVHLETLADVLGVSAQIDETCGPREQQLSAPFAYPVDIFLDTTRLRDLIGDVPVVPLRDSWSQVAKWECSRERRFFQEQH